MDTVLPMGTGKRAFELSFFHANYPDGVRDKQYKLQTIHRGKRGLLARSLDHDPYRFLFIKDVTTTWLRQHFPEFELDSQSPELPLDRTFGATRREQA